MKFWNNQASLQVAAVASALVLTIGAILEYSHQLKSLAVLATKWICRKATQFDRCVFKKLLRHSLGPILVVLGIAGEFVFEGRTFIVEDRQEKQGKETIASLQEKASANAKEAAQLRLKAEELEEQILEQGPRDLLLYGKREESFTNSIRQFKGQKVQVRICVFGNNEVRDTAERLTALFEKAEWDVSTHSPNWGESNCMLVGPNVPIPSGIWVGTPNPRPTTRARERAKELVRFLSHVPLAATLHRVGIETARSGKGTESINQQYGDPDSIVVTILGHPSEAATRNSATVSPIALGP